MSQSMDREVLETVFKLLGRACEPNTVGMVRVQGASPDGLRELVLLAMDVGVYKLAVEKALQEKEMRVLDGS